LKEIKGGQNEKKGVSHWGALAIPQKTKGPYEGGIKEVLGGDTIEQTDLHGGKLGSLECSADSSREGRKIDFCLPLSAHRDEERRKDFTGPSPQ